MMNLLTSINPGLILIIAGVLCSFIPVSRIRQVLALAAPIIGIVLLMSADQEMVLASYNLMGMELVFYQVDQLSFLFGLVFMIAATLNAIYGWGTAGWVEDSSALIYSGAAVCAAFVGDLMSLFIFWELTAIASVFLIFMTGTRAAYAAGMRYLGVQILSGLLLLMGASSRLVSRRRSRSCTIGCRMRIHAQRLSELWCSQRLRPSWRSTF